MKKNIKQILSALMVLLILFGALPITVFATKQTNPLDYLNYGLIDGEISITDCDTSISGELIIPETIDGFPVTRIGRWAFSNCDALTSIVIPNSITSISYHAFDGCAGLTSIKVSNNNNVYDSRYNCNAIIETENSRLILGCPNTVIPNDVTSIGGSAFFGCTNLKSVTIPDSVTSIESTAFYGCTGLTNIKIPSSVKNIDTYAFENCTNLISIKVSDNMIYMGTDVFRNTAFYNDELNWDNDILYIGNYLIDTRETLSGSCVIRNGTKLIAENAFNSCEYLTDITLPSSIIGIGFAAFSECTNLKSIAIPNSVTNIESATFIRCNSLISITIPNSVASIGYRAFYNCNSLTDVYYSGSEQEWNNIAMDDGNDYLKNATIHFKSTDHAHTWSEWTVVKEATTTAEGQEKRTCSVCDKVETRAIEKLKVIKDDKTGIEINYNNEYDSDTEIKVEEQFSGKSFQLINTEFGKVNSKIYDIATYKDGVKVQPNGEITVKVPLPDGFTTNKVFVCYVDSVSGKVTKIPCEVKDGYVIFKTNHFSEYAIVEQSANVKSVSVSDITLNYKKSTTIKPTIKADEGAKYSVKYSSSNTKVATVDENGKVYAAKKGSATITCTVTDSNGNTVSDTCKVTVKYSFGQWLIKILLFGWIWY